MSKVAVPALQRHLGSPSLEREQKLRPDGEHPTQGSAQVDPGERALPGIQSLRVRPREIRPGVSDLRADGRSLREGRLSRHRREPDRNAEPRTQPHHPSLVEEAPAGWRPI
jgi:hypothetical protein